MAKQKRRRAPNGPPVTFAMSFRHWRSGKIVTSKTGKPFPIRGRRRPK